MIFPVQLIDFSICELVAGSQPISQVFFLGGTSGFFITARTYISDDISRIYTLQLLTEHMEEYGEINGT